MCLECDYSSFRDQGRHKPISNSTKVSGRDNSVGLSVYTEEHIHSDPIGDLESTLEIDLHDVISWTGNNATTPATNLSTASPGSDLSFTLLSVAPSLVDDVDKSLFNHYTKVVAVVLSRKSDQRANPFLTNIVPVALSNKLVMDALLALSASHWKKLQPRLWKRGILHQTNTLQSLAKLIPHIRDDTVDGALLATLLLAMVELFDGKSSSWKYHLDGVRQLLSTFKARGDGHNSTSYRIFYNQLYHYLDSATTISTCHPPLLESSNQETVGSPSYSLEDEESLYGIPRSLFHFVDKINSLAYQRKFRDDPVFSKMFEASANSLQTEIEQWAQDHHIHEPSSPGIYCSSRTAVDHATVAFEQALQLRLHQVVNGYSLRFERVKACVTRILDSIQEIPYGNAIESSLIFPLVMAGGSCESEQERLIIDDRLLVMQRTLGFRYVYIAHDLVQRVWKERDASPGVDTETNWASIRFYEIPGLALV